MNTRDSWIDAAHEELATAGQVLADEDYDRCCYLSAHAVRLALLGIVSTDDTSADLGHLWRTLDRQRSVAAVQAHMWDAGAAVAFLRRVEVAGRYSVISDQLGARLNDESATVALGYAKSLVAAIARATEVAPLAAADARPAQAAHPDAP